MGPAGRPNGPQNGQGGGGQAAPGGQRGAPPLGQYGMLHVIGGNDRGKQFELSKVLSGIGRGADQDLVLADIAVSRKHIKIHLMPNGYRLQDLGSGNGTLVNGKRVDEVQLMDGDQIELGNTLLRFEHPPSRPQQEAPPQAFPPPAAYPPPQQMQPPPYAPQGVQAMQPQPYIPQPMPVIPGPPYGSQAAPLGAPVMMPPQMGMEMRREPGFLATKKNCQIAFTAVGAALLVGVIGLVAQVFGRSAPINDVSTVLELHTKGTKDFIAGDYAAAKKTFLAALQLAPDSADLKRYIDACDIEAEAKTFIESGKAELGNRKYGEALRAFMKVEKKSVQFDYAQQQASDARREAANTALTEAKDLSLRDVDAAMSKINEGLEYDPDNPALLELRARVSTGATIPALPKDEPPVPKKPKVQVAQAPPRKEKKPAPTPAPVVQVVPGADLLSNKGAMASYRVRDFAGAINAMQNFAKITKGPAQEKALATVKDIQEVRTLIDQASRMEGTPKGAQLYASAAAIDRRISGGVLQSFFSGKTQAGKAPSAVPPRQQPTQVAFPGTQGDAQKDAKADQLLAQANAVARKNPTEAKNLCRQVLKLYNNLNHPKAKIALRLINSLKGSDEDED